MKGVIKEAIDKLYSCIVERSPVDKDTFFTWVELQTKNVMLLHNEILMGLTMWASPALSLISRILKY